MTILSDKKIREAMEKGYLIIEPPPIDIEPASIDLRVGKQAFAASLDEVTKLDQGKLLVLPAGELALIVTKEKLKFNNRMVGHMGLRSEYTRRGLVLLAGPQIDPGFDAHLHIAVCNLSPTELSLSYEEPFLTVEFHELPEPVERPYSGMYQNQENITPKEIRDIKERRGYALSEVIKNMQRIASDISGLKDAVIKFSEAESKLSEQVNRHMGIFVKTIIALAISIVSILFALFIALVLK